LFLHIQRNYPADKVAAEIIDNFEVNLNNCKRVASTLAERIPDQWNIPGDLVKSKLAQLFDPNWCKLVLENFNDCLAENCKR
jgi:hypothetical protein